eukprot:gene36319-47267_t
MAFKIGSPPGTVLKCCRVFFFQAYSLKATNYIRIISELKKEMGVISNEFCPTLSLRSHLTSDFIKELVKSAKSKGYDLALQQIQAMSIPNTPQSVRCFSWMDYYFRLLADDMPNLNEKHLEPTDYLDIYVEYLEDIEREGHTPFAYSPWKVFWDNVFPHVKVRELKAVTGKCLHCAMLAHARSTFTL